MLKAVLKAIAAGAATGLLFLVILPITIIYINSYFGLPGFSFWAQEILGVSMMLAGAGMFLYCTGLFAYFGKGTPAPIEPPRKLVVRGIYRHTRNPMYLGYFAVVLGEFFWFGSGLLLVYFLFIVGLINTYLIFWEEPRLRKRFGSDYDKYTNRVPRWFIKI